jgi:hypothetical protein
MLRQAASKARLQWSPEHRQPSAGLVLLAAVASILGSLAADAFVVVVGTAILPATSGYGHFRFPDYAKLTVSGVVIASAAWPIVTRVTLAPRWLFFRLAIVVTLVLFLPDVYLLYRRQPADAVGVLMVMHVAIALVAYNLLVRVAPVGVPDAPAAPPR